MAVSLINRSTAIFILLFSICSLAHAVDRNSVTNKFNWGDDLSETPYTSDCPAGTLNCTQAPPTQFKSTHLPDIKQAIDLSVTACSITSDVYLQTDREAISQIGYPGKLVSSTHVNNLRRAIEELYRQKSQPPPGYLSGDVTTGTPILKAHINDMRRALDELVVSCSGVTETPGACGENNLWGGGLNCMAGEETRFDCAPNERAYYSVDTKRRCCPMNPFCYEDNVARCVADPTCGAPASGVWACTSAQEVGNYCDLSKTCGACTIGDMSLFDGYAGALYEPGVDCPANATCDPIGLNCVTMDNCLASPQRCRCGGCLEDGEPLSAMGVCQWPDKRYQVHPDGTGQCCSGYIVQSCATYQEPWEITCATEFHIKCGNNVLNPDEQCDDGNRESGDGCSWTCQTEACLPVGGTYTFGGPAVAAEQCGSSECCSGTAICQGNTGTCVNDSSCQPDGYSWDRGQFAIVAAELIDAPQCCAGVAVCMGGTRSCSCGSGGSGGGCPPSTGFPPCQIIGGPEFPCMVCTGLAPVCGNSVREGTEACDLGMAGNGPCPKLCSASCTSNTCAAATCVDGIQNQTETGVDCGGPCAACASPVLGPCGAATCYACGGFQGRQCRQDNVNGMYDDPSCYGDCDLGDGSVIN